MNQFFYETRGREKIKNLREEGMRSQALRRSGASTPSLLHGLPKLIVSVLGILGILGLLIR